MRAQPSVDNYHSKVTLSSQVTLSGMATECSSGQRFNSEHIGAIVCGLNLMEYALGNPIRYTERGPRGPLVGCRRLLSERQSCVCS